jgi:adenylate cyclase
VERRLVAILSADGVGYSRLMAEDEDATVRTLAACRDGIGLLVRQHRGRVVDSPGDELLAEFPTATEAVTCALEIQGWLGVQNAPVAAERRLEFRIGVHLGEVRVEGERLYGDGVNIAARLQALAEPGGVCVSATVRDQLGKKLAASYQDLGPQSLKNIPEPVRTYRVRSGESAAPPRARRPGRRRGPIRSLAVLPLENLSGDPTQEYFADGMTEALIGDLGNIRSLRVISRTSVMRYKGARKALPEIATELGVDALLEGTVMREGERVRITAQLIDARTDHHLWSERFDRELRGVLELQSDVARAVARRIELELTPAEAARLGERPRVDPAAHDALLRGIYQVGRSTLESLRSAIASFERAIELDPGYALAHAWLSLAWWVLTQPLGALPPLEGMPRAKTAALRAIEADPGLAEAHGALGRVVGSFDWDFAAAERHVQTALRLNPSIPWVYQTRAFQLAAFGRPEEGIAAMRRAVELAPLDLWMRNSLAEISFFARAFDAAVAATREVVAMDPSRLRAHRLLARTLDVLNRHGEAIGEHELAGALLPAEATALRAALAGGGALGYWRERLRIARDAVQQPLYPTLIEIHARLGDHDAAFAELERAYAARLGQLSLLRVDARLDLLRDDPRFAELVRRIGIPEN